MNIRYRTLQLVLLVVRLAAVFYNLDHIELRTFIRRVPLRYEYVYVYVTCPRAFACRYVCVWLCRLGDRLGLTGEGQQ